MPLLFLYSRGKKILLQWLKGRQRLCDKCHSITLQYLIFCHKTRLLQQLARLVIEQHKNKPPSTKDDGQAVVGE